MVFWALGIIQFDFFQRVSIIADCFIKFFMKRIIALLAGLITTGVVTALAVWIAITTDFSLQSFLIIFIVPIGSILLGAIGGVGYALTLKLLNQKAQKFDYIINILFGLAVGFFIYFALFSITYITSQGDVFYSIRPLPSATPIAYLPLDDGTVFDFPRYMFEDITHRQISFSSRGGKTIDIPENATVGWIHFILETLGYIFGGLCIMLVFINTKYCDRCKKYFAHGDREIKISFDKTEDIEKISSVLHNRSSLQDLFKILINSEGKRMLGLSIDSCKQCGDGVLKLSIHEMNSEGKPDQIYKFDKEVLLHHFSPQEGFDLKGYMGGVS